jgi:hypothetical protein
VPRDPEPDPNPTFMKMLDENNAVLWIRRIGFNSDPDPNPGSQTMQIHADPEPGQTFTSQKDEKVELFKRKILYFKALFTKRCEYGSGRIRNFLPDQECIRKILL